jgi:glycine cleavage system regulatory protein
MHQHLVLTLVGPDRPGLVETIARTVTECGGNWLESRMARLGGQFAGMVRVDAGSATDELVRQLEALDGPSLRILVSRGGAAAVVDGGEAHRLDVVGVDRKGIVRDVTSAIAGAGVNVESLETKRTHAAMSGQPMFTAHAVIRVVHATQLDQVRERIEAIAHDLMVDMALLEDTDA